MRPRFIILSILVIIGLIALMIPVSHFVPAGIAALISQTLFVIYLFIDEKRNIKKSDQNNIVK